MKNLFRCFTCLALVLTLSAETTRVWEQKGFEDFDKGAIERLSLRSDGRLMLAPRFRQLRDLGLTYIWALAEDSRGHVYAGGGSPAKIVRFRPEETDRREAPGRAGLRPAKKEEKKGDQKEKEAGKPDDAKASAEPKPETVFETKELEVHALAVDRDDNLYAATSPDPKIYKITPDGKSTVFFEPQAKYVWALVFDAQGNLLVATGDKGELYRVDRKGQAKLFFNSDEAHIRSIALDKSGNVIVGTEPSGLILRVSPAGEAFVLYQAAKKEVTAIEVGPDGSIYAAVVGDKQPRMTGMPMPVIVQPAPPVQGAIPPGVIISTTAPPLTGGSEIYRIFPDGEPRRLWSSREDVIYAMTFNASGKLLLGSGNKGKVYQLDETAEVHTTLVKAQASQVTAFLRLRGGALYLATSNVGKLMELGNDHEVEGWIESEVLDARNFARWGRVFWRAESSDGAAVTLYTRSGNVDNPDRNWSPWSRAYGRPGEASASPGARFIQWKATLTAKAQQPSPWLDFVEIAYFPKNLPPVVDDVQPTPPGHRFQTNPAPPAGQPPVPVSLPPLGQPRQVQPVVQPPRFDPPAQLLPQKGSQGVRWAARDDNEDTLIFSLYFRGKEERTWKLLKDKITDKFYSWDSTALPDGTYYVKVVASDSPSNSEQDALSDERESGPFIVDNTPPQITGLKAALDGGKLRISFRAEDALSPIKKAEYSLDGSEWRVALSVDRISDSLQEEYSFLVPEAGPGEHVVAVRVQDRVENLSIEKIVVR